MTYHPDLRAVPVRVYTRAGWLTGNLHPLKAQRLLDFLNARAPILKLTNAQLPGQQERVPFFALERDAAMVVVPPEDESYASVTDPVGAKMLAHPMVCLVDSVTVSGTLDILATSRISDHLRAHGGYVVIRNAFLQMGAGEGRAAVGPCNSVLVHASHVVGFSEPPVGDEA